MLNCPHAMLVLAGTVALLGGCNAGTTGAPNGTCTKEADCPVGEGCFNGHCSPPFVDDAGVRDAGTHDGGLGNKDPDAGSELTDAGVDAGQMQTGVPITCSTASTSYLMNGTSACGTERWSVKTATDDDVLTVEATPQLTTIEQLTSLPVPANQSAECNRNPPTESQVWELQNVNLHFVSLESDSDYHIVASDNSGHTMIVEAVYPGCVGHDSCSSNDPFLCEITHARASADAIYTSRQDTVGTVMGIGFFDFTHGQTGVAPNAIELHPILAICFGQDCDPLQGY